MHTTRFLARCAMFGVPGLRRLPGLARLALARGLTGVQRMVIDDEDRQQIRRALDGDRATFLAPNHPEVFTDMLLDWELTSQFGMRTAFWAGAELVNGPLRHIWLRHNMIANTPDGGGKRHSVQTALDGGGVLLHPEGDVHWTRDTVHGLFGGVASLARRTAQQGQREVWIQPILYKSAFVGPERNVLGGLHREMDVIERRLGLDDGAGMDLGRRFAELRMSLLRQRRAVYGLEERTIDEDTYAVEHQRFLEELLELSGTDAVQGSSAGGSPLSGPDADRDPKRGWMLEQRERMRQARKLLQRRDRGLRQRGLGRAAPSFGNWRLMGEEIRRLYGESDPSYFGPTLRLEHVAESLKRIREQLFVGRFTDVVRAMMPVAVAPRVVVVRAPAPVVVAPGLCEVMSDEDRAMRTLWLRMQSTLDQLDARLAEHAPVCTLRNPLAPSPGPTALLPEAA